MSFAFTLLDFGYAFHVDLCNEIVLVSRFVLDLVVVICLGLRFRAEKAGSV